MAPSLRVFIGSTSERQAHVEELVAYIQRNEILHGRIEPVPWYGAWGQGTLTLEGLEQCISSTDGAILFLTPDDITSSRGQERQSPRDNLIFEAGLFLGAHGRKRTRLLVPRPTRRRQDPQKNPSDLLGLHLEYFTWHSGGDFSQSDLPNVVRKVCEELLRLGPREKPEGETLPKLRGTESHVERIETLVGDIDKLTVDWILPFLPTAKKIDLVNAYRVNESIVRHPLFQAFKDRKTSQLRACFLDPWDAPLIDIHRRKLGRTRTTSYIQDAFKASINRLLSDDISITHARNRTRVKVLSGKPLADFQISVTNQRITYTYCRVDNRALIVPLDMKKKQDPRPLAWLITTDACPAAFQYYLSDVGALFSDGKSVYKSRP
ncbi:MAG: hypothetical protein DIJKHBIC_02295 [Thermoanaerobaculia bacterium]|nr:hypothetical protein [Thermoanaerobaculia bacterium]